MVRNILNLLIFSCLSLLLVLIEIHILVVLRDHILRHALMWKETLVLLHHHKIIVCLMLIIALLH